MFTSGNHIKEKLLHIHWVGGISVGDHKSTKKEDCVDGDSEARGLVYISEVLSWSEDEFFKRTVALFSHTDIPKGVLIHSTQWGKFADENTSLNHVCWLILWHLVRAGITRETHLGVSLRAFPESINWGEKPCSEQAVPPDGHPRDEEVKRKRDAAWLPGCLAALLSEFRLLLLPPLPFFAGIKF